MNAQICKRANSMVNFSNMLPMMKIGKISSAPALFLFILWLFLHSASLAEAIEEMFGLDALLAEALQNNPEILALKNRHEAARAMVPQALSPPDPWLGLEYEEVPKGTLDLGQAPMRMYSVRQMVPFPTKLFTRATAASKAAKSAFEEYKEKENEVIQKVTSAYAELFLLYKAIDITTENKILLEQLSQTAATRYSLGETSQQDALKAQVEIARMDTELIMLEQRRQVTVAKLNVLLNRDPWTELARPDVKEDISFDRGLDELYRLAREKRPELRAAKFNVERGKLVNSLAIQEYLPDFMIEFEQRERDGHTDGYDIMGAVSVPIWFWEKQNYNVKETRKELKMLEAEYRMTENMALLDVKEAHSRVETLKKLVTLYKTSFLPQAEQTLKASSIGYESNQVDFLNLLDSQRMLLEFKLDYYRNLVELEIALADLERGVGVDLK